MRRRHGKPATNGGERLAWQVLSGQASGIPGAFHDPAHGVPADRRDTTPAGLRGRPINATLTTAAPAPRSQHFMVTRDSHPAADHPATAAPRRPAQPSFLQQVATAPAPVIGIINQPDLWPWNLVPDRSRPLPAALEWRLDSLFGADLVSGRPLPDPAALPTPPLPLLLTARHPDEGGEHGLSADQRAALLRHFLPVAAAVDIELRSMDELARVATEARQAGKLVLASAHDFDGTPDADRLAELIRRGEQSAADAVKIAARTDDAVSLLRLLAPLADRPKGAKPLILMGMGRLGRISRLTAVALGSPLAYGHLGHANVAGQWHAVELAEVLIRQASGGDDV